MVVGALLCYVLGGVLGRLLDRQQGRAVGRLVKVPPGELFAGTLVGTAGLLLGVALTLPLLAVFHSSVVYPIVTLVGWVFAWFGFRLGVVKGRQVTVAAGLSRILAPPTEPPPHLALLVDTSALLDRAILVLGQSGLLVGGLVLPRSVVDEAQTLAAAPDPATSRRAHRGLEAIEALREEGVTVHVADEELPEIADPTLRLVEMARRLGLRLATTSAATVDLATERGVAVTDLRRLADQLLADHPAGERLTVDLVKPGTQGRQAVGYLPDGDMVVVADADHLVGELQVPVEVLSTRRTQQGMLVFARLSRKAAGPRADGAGSGAMADGIGGDGLDGEGGEPPEAEQGAVRAGGPPARRR